MTRVLLGLAFVALLAGLIVRTLLATSPPALCEALGRRRIVHVFAAQDVAIQCEGVHVERADAALISALAAAAPEPLLAVLRAHKGSAVAVGAAASAGVGAELAHRAHVPGLRGVLISPELAVYAPAHEIELTHDEREALAYVARALLRGAREPSIASFPASLRRVERVEVMVMLSRRGEPRMWRSARATSVARALLTATRVARDRWREREQAMGGPLPKRLLELDVEVSLLSEDGQLLSFEGPFVDRTVTAAHGIGFDHRTAWYYVLPRDVGRAGGAFKALNAQLREQGLTLNALQSDARVYRFLPISLGVSRAPLRDGEVP